VKKLEEARMLAWAAAEHQVRVDHMRERGKTKYEHSTKDLHFGRMANMIRDLVDDLEQRL
jgi:hypothetical protein